MAIALDRNVCNKLFSTILADVVSILTSVWCNDNSAHTNISKNYSNNIILFSAGAGRTGTYIAIDNLTEEFNKAGKVDVVETVMKMRQNRKDMVQNAVKSGAKIYNLIFYDESKIYFRIYVDAMS